MVRVRGASRRSGQSTSRIAAISAIFLAIISTTWLIGRQILAPSAPVPADRYKGLVQLAPDNEGRCAQFELDNKTGYLWPKGSTPCGDITTALPARSPDGTLGRLNGIANHFRGQ
jgi:hypothetical protein